MATKELARQLGFLRKQSSSTKERNLRKIRKTNQIFAYLIVIDFESTCWKDQRSRPQEIIEFPAVLLNTSNGEIESTFHHYVQPQEHPTLSVFCKELTDISQDQVEDGIPINLCLSRFKKWLNAIQQERGLAFNTQPGRGVNRCTFVTWSDWDLGVCLHYECRRKQIRKPDELTSWIDLRATYRKFYGRKPNGLNGALKDLGIEFEGREHSGLDDAKNTAKLAWRMMGDGCVMQITKSLQPNTTGSLFTNINSSERRNGNNNSPQKKPLVLMSASNQDRCGLRKNQQNAIGGSFMSFESNTNAKISLGSVPEGDQENVQSKHKIGPASLLQCKGSTPMQSIKPIGSSTPVLSTACQFKKPSPLRNRVLSNLNSTRQMSSNLSTKANQKHTYKPSPIHSHNHSIPMNKTASTTMWTPDCNRIASTHVKKTPPMCKCGRRAQRKTVQNAGPNMGRFFFSCPKGKPASGNCKGGCGFFKWDSHDEGSYSKLSPNIGSSVQEGSLLMLSKLQQPNFDSSMASTTFSTGKRSLGTRGSAPLNGFGTKKLRH